MKKILFAALAMLMLSEAFAQKEKSPFSRYGRVSKTDLEVKSYSIDTNANAVVLSHIGDSYIEGNSRGWFSLRTSIHKVTHILNEKGYDEANVEVMLYGPGDEEGISNFKAVTYNLENGKVAQSKLNRSALIRERIDKNRTLVKFTMPNVKPGSIIEYSYQVISEYISYPDPWYFQSTTTPTLWSEFNMAVPEFFQYQVSSRGFVALNISETTKRESNFRVIESRTTNQTSVAEFKSDVMQYRWGIKDVPELKTEPFTKSVKNHLARLEFQLAAQQHPLKYRSLRSSWAEITKGMLEADNFGKHLSTSNNWMRDELASVLGDEKNQVEQARKLFYHVRDNFKITQRNQLFMNDNLRSIFRARSGGTTELNVLLTAMLRHIGLEATPLMLSTASNGYAMEYSPLLNTMNYIVCRVTIDGQDYLLDASHDKLGFGRLPAYCYNGFSVSIDPAATPVNLMSDDLNEETRTLVFFSNTENGYLGTIRKQQGYYSSFDFRNNFSEQKKEEYIDDVKKKHGDFFDVFDYKVSALNDYELPAVTEYQLKMKLDDEAILYLNPYFGHNTTRNPFVSAERTYPVEFPFQMDENVTATIEIPEGYQIDELPKPIIVHLDQNKKSFFEYRIGTSDRLISFQSRLKIGQTFFMPEEYNSLREFFNYVVKKQSEQIVLKKID